MKNRLHFFVLLVMAFAFCSTVFAQNTRSEKRGIGENSFSYEEEVDSLAKGVSWYYNWGPTPTAAVDNVVGPGKAMDFYPMAWNGSFDENKIRTYLTNHPGVKYLLTFNEPNFTAQANMTPTAAAAVWPTIEKIADDFNLKIVGPALNYSPNAPYTDPTTWYDEFFSLLPNARVDYLALHCYMDGSDGMMAFINKIANRYNKKIWLTEFCSWESTGLTAEQQINSMVQKVEALELSPNVFKYAWFKAKGSNAYPYYALLKYKNLSQGIPAGALTAAGIVYTNMSTFDLTHYYSCTDTIAATNYVKSSSITVEVNNDPANPYKLRIGSFDQSATLDYLINVPTAGTYTLSIRMASEQFLFDPTISVLDSNKVELGKRTFAATGSVDTWTTDTLHVILPAGNQRITLMSTASTTCKLGWIAIKGISTGMKNIAANSDISCYRNGDILYVKSNSNSLIKELSVCNLVGNVLIQNSEKDEINVSSLSHGVYLISIHLKNGSQVNKKVCF